MRAFYYALRDSGRSRYIRSVFGQRNRQEPPSGRYAQSNAHPYLTQKSEIGTDGYLHPSEDSNAKDFTNSTTDDDNIFDLADGAILVPGSTYEATMKIENKGTVAFDYNVTVVLTTPQGTESEAFANQLKFTTGKVGETGTSTTLAAAGSNPIFSGFLKGGAASAESFFLKIEFINENGTVNNAAQAGDVKFDLVVTATQQTTAPTAGN